MQNQSSLQSFTTTGLFTLTLRLVVGWTYFSAFWRRLILADKLDPDSIGYIGEKFNHFLPNALGIKPIIEYLVTHPEALWWNMAIFTIIEAIVGLFIMLGFITRLMSIGVMALALGILLGSGWIGTTCLDEWQIGVLGIATGFTLLLTGGGYYSLDWYFIKRKIKFTQTKWFARLGSGDISFNKTVVLAFSIAILFLTLFTNQYFHGGLYGELHNKSIRPKLEISNATIQNNTLQFEVFRTEGVDVYGSFLIGIQLLDKNGQLILEKTSNDLAQFPKENIHNHYVTKIKPGKHSLIIPLGAKADISIALDNFNVKENQPYQLKLIDISGLEWTQKLTDN